MVYNAHVHQLTVYLYVRTGALRAMTCIKIGGSEKSCWFSCYLLCADIELLKSKSREFPKCV